MNKNSGGVSYPLNRSLTNHRENRDRRFPARRFYSTVITSAELQGNQAILSQTSISAKAVPLKLGTRGSPLALAQARTVQACLAAAHGTSSEAIEIVVIKTSGDEIQDRALAEAGGKGLFTKELDTALIRGDIDLAVHSAKDLPTLLPPEIAIAGYLPREDVRDVWICQKAAHPRDLPPGATVGTASLRRGALLKKLRNDLNVTLLRGNVETRLAKVAVGEIDATLLALAGLRRLGLADRARAVLDIAEFVPAVGQGAVAVTARCQDLEVEAYLAPIFDAATGTALAAERAFLHVLDGSCRTPIGGYAQIIDGVLVFQGIILRPDGSAFFETLRSGAPRDAQALGEAAGQELRARAPVGFLEA